MAYKAPLYERRTAQLKIQPFDFFEACCCFEKFENYDKALAYGIVGGTPQYLLQLNDALSVEENIKNTYLNPTSSIFEEPTNLLKREVREPAIYNAVIAPQLPSYMGGVFEDICKQYLWKLLLTGKCAVNFEDIGRWWGTNPQTKSQEEIDIMGADHDTALFGECKWTNEKVGLNVLENLVERSKLFYYKETYIAYEDMLR